MCQVEGVLPAPGTALKARILDVSKDTGIVDVTLRPKLVEAAATTAATHTGKARRTKGEKQQKLTKKRKAAEALDAAHADDHLPKVSLPISCRLAAAAAAAAAAGAAAAADAAAVMHLSQAQMPCLVCMVTNMSACMIWQFYLQLRKVLVKTAKCFSVAFTSVLEHCSLGLYGNGSMMQCFSTSSGCSRLEIKLKLIRCTSGAL